MPLPSADTPQRARATPRPPGPSSCGPTPAAALHPLLDASHAQLGNGQVQGVAGCGDDLLHRYLREALARELDGVCAPPGQGLGPNSAILAFLQAEGAIDGPAEDPGLLAGLLPPEPAVCPPPAPTFTALACDPSAPPAFHAEGVTTLATLRAAGPAPLLMRGEALSEGDRQAWCGVVEGEAWLWGLPFCDELVWLGREGEHPGPPDVLALRWQLAWGPPPPEDFIGGSTYPISAAFCVQALQVLPAWGLLQPPDARGLLVLLGEPSLPYAEYARWAFHVLIHSETWAGAPHEDQARMLVDFLRDPERRSTDLPPPAVEPSPYAVEGPEAQPGFEFRGETRDALVFTLAFADGQRLPLVLPAALAEEDPGQRALAMLPPALAAMPPDDRHLIQIIVVNPVANPDDPRHRASGRYDPDHVSAMSANRQGEVHVYPAGLDDPTHEGLTTTLLHEAGHVLSMTAWGPYRARPPWDLWRQAMALDAVTPTDYAATDEHEDFAETMEIYAATAGQPEHEAYRLIFPARFAVIDGLRSVEP